MAILGLILAGGEGRRMAGQDKGLLEIDGRPLASFVLKSLQPFCSDVVISCNRHLKEYRRIAPQCLEDQADIKNSGPLAGLLTTIRHYPNHSLLVSPCDTPLLTEQYGKQMLNNDKGDQAKFATTGRDHYLHCLIPPNQADSLENYLNSGKKSVKGWLHELNAKAVNFSGNAGMFTNVNDQATLADLVSAANQP